MATKVCICIRSPEAAEAEAKRMLESWPPCANSEKHFVLFIDHRCPKHGEKVQPALWGRHKEHVLAVKPHEWLSLGVEETKES